MIRWLERKQKSGKYTLGLLSGSEIAIFEPFSSPSPKKIISSPFRVEGFCQSGYEHVMVWGQSNTVLYEGWTSHNDSSQPQILIPMPSTIGWPLAAPFQQYRDFLTVGKRNGNITAWSLIDQLNEPKVCMPVKLYESELTSAYGPGLLVEKVGSSHWVVVQKNGWTLVKWETEDDEPGLHQEISADLEGIRGVIQGATGTSPSFGFFTASETVFWVSSGHSQLVEKADYDSKYTLDSCFYDNGRIIGIFTGQGETATDFIDVTQWPLSWSGELTKIQVDQKETEDLAALEDPDSTFTLTTLTNPSQSATCAHIDSHTALIGFSNGTIVHLQSQKHIRGFTGSVVHLFELAKEFRTDLDHPVGPYVAISASSEVGIVDFNGDLKYLVPGHHAGISKLVTYVNLPYVLGVKYLDSSKRLWSLETNGEYQEKLSPENWEIELHCLCTSGSKGQVFVDSRDSGLSQGWAVNIEALLTQADYVELLRSVLQGVAPDVGSKTYTTASEKDPFYTLLRELKSGDCVLSGSVSPCGTWLYDSGLLCVSPELTASYLPVMVALADTIHEAQEGKRLQLLTLKPLADLGYQAPSPTTLALSAVQNSSSQLKRAAKQCLQAYFGDLRYDEPIVEIYNSHNNLLFDPRDPTPSCVSLYIITAIARVTGEPDWAHHVLAVIRNGLETDSLEIQGTSLDCFHSLWPSLKPGLSHIVDIEAVVSCLASNPSLNSECWTSLGRVSRSNTPLLITSLVFLLENLDKPLNVRITAVDVLSKLLSQSSASSSMDMFVPFILHTAAKMLNPDLLRLSAGSIKGVSIQTKVTSLLSSMTHNFPHIVTFHKPSQRLAVAIYPTATAVMIEKNVSRRRSSLSELNRDLDIKVTDTSSLIVYDLRIGSEYAYLDPQEFNSNHAAPVWGLVFSPDGKMVAGLTGIGSNTVPGSDFTGEYRAVVWRMETHTGTFSALFGHSSNSSHSGVYSESVKFGKKDRNVVERQVEILLYASVGKIGYRDKQTPSFEPAKVETLGNLKDSTLAITWLGDSVFVVKGHKFQKKIVV